MPHARRRLFRPAVLVTAAAFGGAVLAPIHDARADDVSPKGKGIAGGALLGAEVVTIVESFIGVRSGWAYAIGALVGAGGGAAGGYVVEHGNTDGKVPTYMLAGGLALIIPALVLTLNATRYMPEEGATEDRAPIAPAAEPGAPGGTISGVPGSVPAPPGGGTSGSGTGAPGAGGATGAAPGAPPASPAPAAPPPPPQSLLDVVPGRFRVGVPVPDVRPVFTVAEQRQYGTKNDTELRMPVLHVSF
jgi:hypothetical protein